MCLFFFLFKDFVCPRCDSGFIEEVTEDSRYSSVSKRVLKHALKY